MRRRLETTSTGLVTDGHGSNATLDYREREVSEVLAGEFDPLVRWSAAGGL